MHGTCLKENGQLRRNRNTVLAFASRQEIEVVAISATSKGSKEVTARLTTSILSAKIILVTGVPKTFEIVLVVLYFISSTSAPRLT